MQRCPLLDNYESPPEDAPYAMLLQVPNIHIMCFYFTYYDFQQIVYFAMC